MGYRRPDADSPDEENSIKYDGFVFFVLHVPTLIELVPKSPIRRNFTSRTGHLETILAVLDIGPPNSDLELKYNTNHETERKDAIYKYSKMSHQTT